jgi:uncharacterized protein with PQ loop repeat
MSSGADGQIERYKSLFEYIKHLTTLSTGSVVVLATFLEKIFSIPQWKQLAAISIFCFTASVIASIVTYTFYFLNFPTGKPVLTWTGTMGTYSLIITWTSFIAGIILWTVFTMKNMI